ncbi:hypothetical protein PUNSTDRAFT_52106 [Punctularia strigosozonata HHB-11173 SS5]|uniref:uncharacterized protein n=1 Tax=Punctularia strigosozonata (strain HHB-11173) TaxID=741275 RepID=UPI0004417DC2|nr:uncharacterized protein PUNSTDRAFT_52106 [Punctularia strigosozonata HHB-11173 SS5]EIN09993.1 hypothetical protein PUNSTDRAFT_52106 [Punctularia strigosozonata HHB-11173 SS5]
MVATMLNLEVDETTRGTCSQRYWGVACCTVDVSSLDKAQNHRLRSCADAHHPRLIVYSGARPPVRNATSRVPKERRATEQAPHHAPGTVAHRSDSYF